MNSDGNDKKLSHLKLPELLDGKARAGRPPEKSSLTNQNKANFTKHAGFIHDKIFKLSQLWDSLRKGRSKGAPELPTEIPLLIKVDTTFDIEALRTAFDFELVAEQEDGFMIVAARDHTFSKLLDTIEKFTSEARGGGAVASLHDLSEEADHQERLKRILSTDLLEAWPSLKDDHLYTVDISIECTGKIVFPKVPVQKEGELDHDFSIKMMRYEENLKEAYRQWDQLKIGRETQFENIIKEYNAIRYDYVDGQGLQPIPESFSVRINISGVGLKDLVINYPFIFEITTPDKFDLPTNELVGPDGKLEVTFLKPNENSPTICIIDSGIQEEHPILSSAIRKEHSYSYVDSDFPNDVADQFSKSGHGTRVAGAVLFPNIVPRSGEHEHKYWLLNQRILDGNNKIPEHVMPAAVLMRIIDKTLAISNPPKIYCHSISASTPCPTKHMTVWGSAIDLISFHKDILFIQAAGNVSPDCELPTCFGIKQHLAGGTKYPEYLTKSSCRIASPSQSFNALTVGSVTSKSWKDADFKSFGDNEFSPSSFTRSGLGIWDSIKPDVVEIGGDHVISSDGKIIKTVPETCVELVRATNTKPAGPLFDSSDIGTSFAAPKVASIALELQKILPNEPTLLYRALIALSARWPEWALKELHNDGTNILKMIGYGLPNMDRALTNSPYRITLHTTGEKRIKAREVQVFHVPVPKEIRAQANEQEILLEVCLSFASKPRRTRRNIRGYSGVWLDWVTSKSNQSPEGFLGSVSSDFDKLDNDGDEHFPWVLGKRSDRNIIKNARRSSGSLQKDWAIVKAHELPESFCIAVVGHKGWDLDANAYAKYALAVSFESINKDINIYQPVKVAVDNLTVSVDLEA